MGCDGTVARSLPAAATASSGAARLEARHAMGFKGRDLDAIWYTLFIYIRKSNAKIQWNSNTYNLK